MDNNYVDCMSGNQGVRVEAVRGTFRGEPTHNIHLIPIYRSPMGIQFRMYKINQTQAGRGTYLPKVFLEKEDAELLATAVLAAARAIEDGTADSGSWARAFRMGENEDGPDQGTGPEF